MSSTCNRGQKLVGSGLECHQETPFFHSLTRGYRDVTDCPFRGGFDHIFHFHGLQNQKGLPLLHFVPCIHQHLKNFPRHRCFDVTRSYSSPCRHPHSFKQLCALVHDTNFFAHTIDAKGGPPILAGHFLTFHLEPSPFVQYVPRTRGKGRPSRGASTQNIGRRTFALHATVVPLDFTSHGLKGSAGATTFAPWLVSTCTSLFVDKLVTTVIFISQPTFRTWSPW